MIQNICNQWIGPPQRSYPVCVIDPARVQVLNEHPTRRGKYVLYWMQASQRTLCNHALEYAAGEGNELKVPLLVGFGLMDNYPEANHRHYCFMLQGLAEISTALEKRDIPFVVRHGSPPEIAIDLSKDASVVVCDRGYLRHQRRWRDRVADAAACRVVQVEADAVVPIEEASEKPEFAARTIRSKIHRNLQQFIQPLKTVAVRFNTKKPEVSGDIDVKDPLGAAEKLKLDRTVRRVDAFEGGEHQAQKRLRHFISTHLAGYGSGRREPADNATSNLSPYLHFGQISPVDIALQVQKSTAPTTDKEAFLEELIVRRELAMNFVYYTPNYDSYDGLPAWARKTLEEHQSDERKFVYSRQELESARTHDPFWNAAQREMLATGFMQNSMRMYWGKKILEWKTTPREAFEDLLYLNNKYFLCGRDPASYANVAWTFGLHDRPWQEREIFGKIRYMNASGLTRKFDMAAYQRRVEQLEST